jgi:hypothetical protein
LNRQAKQLLNAFLASYGIGELRSPVATED